VFYNLSFSFLCSGNWSSSVYMLVHICVHASACESLLLNHWPSQHLQTHRHCPHARWHSAVQVKRPSRTSFTEETMFSSTKVPTKKEIRPEHRRTCHGDNRFISQLVRRQSNIHKVFKVFTGSISVIYAAWSQWIRPRLNFFPSPKMEPLLVTESLPYELQKGSSLSRNWFFFPFMCKYFH